MQPNAMYYSSLCFWFTMAFASFSPIELLKANPAFNGNEFDNRLILAKSFDKFCENRNSKSQYLLDKTSFYFIDEDGDGFTSDADFDDNDAHIYPGAPIFIFQDKQLCVKQFDALMPVFPPVITITESLGLIVNDTIICNGYTTFLDVGSGYDTYLWSTGSTDQSIFINTSGTYSVTVTEGGNMGVATRTISAHNTTSPISLFETSAGVANDGLICPGDPVTLQSTQGTGFTWSNGQSGSSIVVNPTSNSLFNVTVTGNACAFTVSSNVKTPFSIVASSVAVNMVVAKPTITMTENGPNINTGDQNICNTNTATLDAGPGYDSYLWNTGASTQTIMVNTAGDYSVTVTKNGCAVADTQKVIVHSLPVTVDVMESSGIALNDNIICQDDTVCLTVVGGGTSYSWNTGQATSTFKATPQTNALFSVTVTGNACSFTTSSMTITPVSAVASANVTVVSKPSITITESNPTANANDEYICNTNTATLDAGPGYESYLWSTGAITPSIVVNSSGDYSVTVSINGCTFSDTQKVIVHSLPIGIAMLENSGEASNDNVICAGDSVCLIATGGGTGFMWNTGQQDSTFKVAPTSNTQFDVIVTGNACAFFDFPPVFVYPVSATVDLTVLGAVVNAGNDIEICADSTMVPLNGSVTGSLTTGMWSGGTGTFIPNANALNAQYSPSQEEIMAGSAVLILSSVGGQMAGCQDRNDTVIITIYEDFQITQVPDTTICEGSIFEEVIIEGTNPNGTYFWANDNTGIGLPPFGMGTIPQFTAQNPDDTTIRATIKVYENNNAQFLNSDTFSYTGTIQEL